MRAAEYHATHDPRRFPAPAEDEVHDRGEGEYRGEDGVRGEGGAVAVDGFFDGAELLGRSVRVGGEGRGRTSKVQLAEGPKRMRYCFSDIVG